MRTAKLLRRLEKIVETINVLMVFLKFMFMLPSNGENSILLVEIKKKKI